MQGQEDKSRPSVTNDNNTPDRIADTPPSCPSQNVRCGDHAKPTTLTERSGAASCRHEGGARSINQCTKEVQVPFAGLKLG